MILDSSALVALLLAEPGYEQLSAKIKASRTVGIGAPTLVESVLVLTHRLRGAHRELLAELLREMEVEIVPFTEEHYRIAIGAFLRFGKGRHPAALNFGDCLSYATASAAGEPLLFVGNDFLKTDIASA